MDGNCPGGNAGSKQFVTTLVELVQDCMAKAPRDRLKKCKSRSVVMAYFEQQLMAAIRRFQAAQV